jgi:AraC-like DNA-binding protein
MKTKIKKYQLKPRITMRLSELVNVEIVLRRHIMREFKDRHQHNLLKSLQRMDIRDAVRALKTIKNAPVEYANVD